VTLQKDKFQKFERTSMHMTGKRPSCLWCHEGIWGSKSIVPLILNLGTRHGEWSNQTEIYPCHTNI